MTMKTTRVMMLALAVAALAACSDKADSPTAAKAVSKHAPSAQVFSADSSCQGGCAARVLAYTGDFSAGVHSVDLGSLQDGARVYLHVNALVGGGNVQFVTSPDCSTWTSYDPATELSGTSTPLVAGATMMGFDTSDQVRCVGVRNTSSMSGTILLWAYGV